MSFRNRWLSLFSSIPARLVRLVGQNARLRREKSSRYATEALEDRTLLTAYVVNTLVDDVSSDGFISLREAIQAANSNSAFGDASAGSGSGALDTITFHPDLFLVGPATIVLDGQLNITDDLNLIGPGTSLLTLDANSNSRIFYANGLLQTNGTLETTISGLTMTGGAQSTAGAIWQDEGTLTLNEVRITGNAASNDSGGIFNNGGTLNINRSTIDGNSTFGSGGGIRSAGTTTIVNSTISGNSAAIWGGGIFVQVGGPVTIVNSTITGNRSDSEDSGGSNSGGGIHGGGTLYNTIVAGNFIGSGTVANDISATVDTGSTANIIGDAGSAGGLTDGTNMNIVGVSGAGVRDINTILDTVLENNGGQTPTHSLVFGSPAIDAGDDSRATVDGETTSTPLTTDQRGFGRFEIGDLYPFVDIGAVEGIADDYGDDFANAFPVATRNLTGGLQYYGDQDWFSIPMIAGVTYVMTVRVQDGLDSVIELYEPDGSTFIDMSDDAPGLGLGSELSFVAPTSETYYLLIRGLGDASVGPYTLEVNAPLDDVISFDPVTGQWRIGISDGDTFTNSVASTWSTSVGFETYTGDFNGDGLTDIAGWTNSGQWYVGISNGSGGVSTSVWGTWASEAAAGWTQVNIADFNGDGKMDVVGLNTSNQWFVGISSGSSFAFSQWGTLGSGYVAHVVGDFNGDGFADIANLHDTGNWWVHESNGSTLQLDHYGKISSQAERNWRNAMKGDFNGDHVDDILIQDYLGNWFLADGRQNPDGKFTVHYANRWDPTAFVEFFIGDFNGDGYDDMMGRTAGNVWWGNRSLATTTGRMHAQHWGSSGAANTITSAVGDFNGDGFADMATIRSGSNFWFVMLGSASNKFIADGYGPWTGWSGGQLRSGQLN
ncbi:MAG: VCBS repeat-containing protein [Planctomycetaceae bacterium]|nr:VCBS repeat-containing protein [Planctomycetaceae bacterium]